MSRRMQVLAWLAAVAALPVAAGADAPLSIYDVQYTTAADGAGPHEGETIDCAGGVVTHKWLGGQGRLYLQDPARTEWGGVLVKDWTGGGLYNAVAVGDWVSVGGVYVEEHRGNTTLRYDSSYGSTHTVVSSGNPLPAPIAVSPAAIAAPTEGPPGEWYVADHSAEKYEHMRLRVDDVTVTATDLGKAADNYNLHAAGGDCWAADYLNLDVGPDGYHPSIHLGADLAGVTGVFEQYTKLTSGWDYYQLVTTKSADIVPEPGLPALLLAVGLARAGRRRNLPLRPRRRRLPWRTHA